MADFLFSGKAQQIDEKTQVFSWKKRLSDILSEVASIDEFIIRNSDTPPVL